MRKLSNKTMMSGGHCLRWWGGAFFVLTVPALGWSDHATHVPPRFVSDPNFEWTGSGFEVGLVDTVRRERGQAAVTQLYAVVAEQVGRFSKMASQWIARGHLPPEEAAKRVMQQEAVMANE